MPFNGPIDGNWDNVDYTAAPWGGECMTLTHEECLQVLAGLKKAEEEYDPARHNGEALTDIHLLSDYCNQDWEFAINWETLMQLKSYDPEVNTEGLPHAPIEEQIPEGPAE
jgi:hypothetical protein